MMFLEVRRTDKSDRIIIEINEDNLDTLDEIIKKIEKVKSECKNRDFLMRDIEEALGYDYLVSGIDYSLEV